MKTKILIIMFTLAGCSSDTEPPMASQVDVNAIKVSLAKLEKKNKSIEKTNLSLRLRIAKLKSVKQPFADGVIEGRELRLMDDKGKVWFEASMIAKGAAGEKEPRLIISQSTKDLNYKTVIKRDNINLKLYKGGSSAYLELDSFGSGYSRKFFRKVRETRLKQAKKRK